MSHPVVNYEPRFNEIVIYDASLIVIVKPLFNYDNVSPCFNTIALELVVESVNL